MIEEGFITDVEFPERPLPQPVGLLVAFTIVIYIIFRHPKDKIAIEKKTCIEKTSGKTNSQILHSRLFYFSFVLTKMNS